MVDESHLKFTWGSIASIKIETIEKSVIICACYRLPNNDNASNDNLNNLNLLAICKKYKNNLIWIGGDFNLSDVDSLSNNIVGHQYLSNLDEDFLDAFDQAKLTQIVEFSAHKNTTLHLLLATIVVNCEPSPGFNNHDTSILAISVIHKKSHTCERGGAHLRIPFWHLLMNLKNK